MNKIIPLLAFSVALSTAQTDANRSDLFRISSPGNPETAQKAIDPFLAGAAGLIPFVSGFYLTESPERGLVFTLVDILLSLGIYTALHTQAGDPDHVPVYYTFMGINNLVDAYFSAREAMKPAVRPRVTMRPHGGVECAIALTF